jgi:hypothetical protein
MQLRDVCPAAFERMQRLAAARDVPETLTLAAVAVQMIEAGPGEDGRPKLPRFEMTAYTGVQMRLMGWYHPVVIDLEGMELPAEGEQFPAFLLHEPGSIVGHFEAWAKSQKTLKASGVISGTGPAAQEVVGNAKNGFRWKASVGASVQQVEFVEAAKTVKVNGLVHKGPVYVARKSRIEEISFVPIAADNRTSTRVVAEAKRLALDAKFHSWLDQRFERWQASRNA